MRRDTRSRPDDAQLYVSAILDLLGQGEKLGHLRHDMRRGAGIEEVRDSLREIVGTVAKLREALVDFLDPLQTYQANPQLVRKEDEEAFTRSMGFQIDACFLGDAMVVYLPLRDFWSDVRVMNGVRTLFSGLAGFWVLCMAEGHALRGAIAMVFGAVLRGIGDDLYGASVARGFGLEKLAVWPRIVVDDDVIGFLLEVGMGAPSGEGDQRIAGYRRRVAGECLATLVREDGLMTLNPAAEVVRRSLERGGLAGLYESAVARAAENAVVWYGRAVGGGWSYQEAAKRWGRWMQARDFLVARGKVS